MSKATILVAEDDWDLREALSETLELAGFRVIAVGSAEEALAIVGQRQLDMLITDVNMGDMDGHELQQRVRLLAPMVPVLVMTAYGSIRRSVEAMRNGAVDYLVKPFDQQTLVETVRRYIAVPGCSNDDEPVAEEVSSQNLLALARKVAASDATVLISGESGTGKEVLARYLHQQSRRADKVFVAINCAAIPENMLEATLFGHEKGAFTGAYSSNQGKFEQADGGTILLDEISEMDIGLQAKILRVLQEREVERVGGRKTISLDVRVIATTNRDLRQCVAQGTFREDLYYRLSVFPLQWLPLRERRKDIVSLAQRLLQRHARRMGRVSMSFDAAARQLIEGYAWPGNVRELDNVIQRALIIEDSHIITPASLVLDSQAAIAPTSRDPVPVAHMSSVNQMSSLQRPAGISMDNNGGADSTDSEAPVLEVDDGVLGNDLKQREFEIILKTLRQQGGRRKETAEILGVSARTLRYKMARMRDSGINIESLLNVY